MKRKLTALLIIAETCLMCLTVNEQSTTSADRGTLRVMMMTIVVVVVGLIFIFRTRIMSRRTRIECEEYRQESLLFSSTGNTVNRKNTPKCFCYIV